MAVKYLAGNRIIGTAAERTALVGTPSNPVGWKEIGRATSTGSGDITASISDPKEHMMILASDLTDSSFTTYLRFGYNSIDTGSNYEFRGHRKHESDRDSSGGNDTRIMIIDHNTAKTGFVVGNVINRADFYKLYYGVGLQAGATSSDPRNNEFCGKWQNDSNQANRVAYGAFDGSSNLATDSELVVLGYDTDDTETSGDFWQPLANVTLDTAATTINSGTIAAKKYLWVQVSVAGHSSGENDSYRFNSNATSNAYNWRRNANGETTSTEADNEMVLWGTGTTNKMVNTFIYNKANQQKLCTTEIIVSDSGGSPIKPYTVQHAGKWNNTSDAITSIQYGDNKGNSITLNAGSTLSIWGHD